uniref:Uncharacterized protein n=1 Tax=Timspurckia oligopyrenoides TaxID=708627 RepID=A0A7S0ZLZ1_9RHOD
MIGYEGFSGWVFHLWRSPGGDEVCIRGTILVFEVSANSCGYPRKSSMTLALGLNCVDGERRPFVSYIAPLNTVPDEFTYGTYSFMVVRIFTFAPNPLSSPRIASAWSLL